MCFQQTWRLTNGVSGSICTVNSSRMLPQEINVVVMHTQHCQPMAEDAALWPLGPKRATPLASSREPTREHLCRILSIPRASAEPAGGCLAAIVWQAQPHDEVLSIASQAPDDSSQSIRQRFACSPAFHSILGVPRLLSLGIEACLAKLVAGLLCL